MTKFLVKANYVLPDCVTCLDTSKGGAYYAAGLLDESVALWKGLPSKDNQDFDPLEGHFLGVIDLKFSDDQKSLAVSSLDSVIRIWDLQRSLKVCEIQCEQMENWKIAFLDNQTICTAGEGGRVTLYDVLSGKDRKNFTVEQSFATSIANSSNLLAVCTDSGSLHIVQDALDQHKMYHVQKLHKKMIRSVQFTNDGQRAVTGSDDQDIKIVDLKTMKCIRTLSGHTGNVNQVDIHPTEQKILVSCSYDGFVRLWDMTSSQCIEQFQPFDKKVELWGVKFNFDGSLIGVCSQLGQLSFFSKS